MILVKILRYDLIIMITDYISIDDIIFDLLVIKLKIISSIEYNHSINEKKKVNKISTIKIFQSIFKYVLKLFYVFECGDVIL